MRRINSQTLPQTMKSLLGFHHGFAHRHKPKGFLLWIGQHLIDIMMRQPRGNSRQSFLVKPRFPQQGRVMAANMNIQNRVQRFNVRLKRACINHHIGISRINDDFQPNNATRIARQRKSLKPHGDDIFNPPREEIGHPQRYKPLVRLISQC